MAYYALEPFGEERADLRMAINTSSVVNTMRGLWSKSRKALKLQDFLPKFGRKAENTPEAMLATVERINKLFGGEDMRK